MLISRLILIWFLLLNLFNCILLHEIEEKFRVHSNQSNSLEPIAPADRILATPRQSAYGGFTYLAVSLLFQLPLMEIIFVMGLIVLVLGIMLHFVELKADFFRLRRQFLREEKLRIKLEEEERARNRTLAAQGLNQTIDGNPENDGTQANDAFHQNYGTKGPQSYVNYQSYANNTDYGPRPGDQLHSQSSHTLPSLRAPPNRYRQPNRPLRRRLIGRHSIGHNIDRRPHQKPNFQTVQRQRHRQNVRNRWLQNMRRREQMSFG